jgi:hypothetical protein
MSLVTKLNEQSDTDGIQSIRTLKENVKYNILEFKQIETKYGRTVIASLERNGVYLQVFMPKSIGDRITDEDIDDYDGRLQMKFKGFNKKKFDIIFKEL